MATGTDKRKAVSVDDELKMENRKTRSVGNLVFINCTARRIRKNRTKIISAFEQNGQRIKRFRGPERSDVMSLCLSDVSKREVTMYRWAVHFC